MSLTLEQCEEFWGCADKDCNGELSIQELKRGVHEYNPNIQDRDVAMMFCGVDKNEDGKITKEEFLKEMAEKPKRSETICQLFDEFDTSADGKLSSEEIKEKVLPKFFKERDPNEVMAEFSKYVDTSGDGIISREEFVKYFG